MENSIFITHTKDLSFWQDCYSRLYFGNEFCSHLIPSAAELETVIDFVESKKRLLSFVTGYANNGDIKKYTTLFKIIEKRGINAEIIINDWGVFELTSDFSMKAVLGRLLCRQKKGRRVLNVFDRLPKEAKERFQNAALNANFVNFLIKNNIERVEIDNLLQGVFLNGIKRRLSVSLYTPYGYIATTRLCPSSAANQKIMAPLVIPASCDKDCSRTEYFTLSHREMRGDLILKGNTIFYKCENMNLICQDRRVDRIVFQPKAPI